MRRQQRFGIQNAEQGLSAQRPVVVKNVRRVKLIPALDVESLPIHELPEYQQFVRRVLKEEQKVESRDFFVIKPVVIQTILELDLRAGKIVRFNTQLLADLDVLRQRGRVHQSSPTRSFHQ